MNENSGTIQAVDITCRVIEELKKTGSTDVTEIASRLGHSESTVHDYLTTLEKNGFLVNSDGAYRLSVSLLSLAVSVREQFGAYDAIRTELDSIAEETGEVVQFGVEEQGFVKYLYKASGSRGVSIASTIGGEQSMHSTGLGKAILAHYPEERVHEIIDEHGLPSKTSNTITSRTALFEDLQETRERGYAIDDEENTVGLRCFAAPVVGNREVIGAVSISGPCIRFRDEQLAREYPTRVEQAANVIEINAKFD